MKLPDNIKSASELAETKAIMASLYEENPEHWPHGLNADNFDGGLYLLRKQASQTPIGFVGWQERKEGLLKVGYYSVGILPEYRRKGFAKQAMTDLFAKKADTVDVVKGLIVETNTPSISLADKFNEITVDIAPPRVKQARKKKASEIPSYWHVPNALGGLAGLIT